MNDEIIELMAKFETWEAANEFGIPEISWGDLDARKRSDDLYIACISQIFETLRDPDSPDRKIALAEIANTLVIYSKSAAARILTGVERGLNQLYCAAVFYLAECPATASLLTRSVEIPEELHENEEFLRTLLCKDKQIVARGDMGRAYSDFANSGDEEILRKLISSTQEEVKASLYEAPRPFIAAKLAFECLRRFSEANIWRHLREQSSPFKPEEWKPFLLTAGSFPLLELLPSQQTALEHGLLDPSVPTVSLQMPTSSGKTSLCEILIFHEVRNLSRKLLFLVPFRALATEIAEGMARRLKSSGVVVLASYGGNLPTQSEASSVEGADVVITTPEKFSALSHVLPSLEETFDTIICDEGHLIDDKTRGVPYELLLARLKKPSATDRRFIFMSAILPNVADLHAWLGGKPESLARSDYKPVRADNAFLIKRGLTYDLLFNPEKSPPGSYTLSGFLNENDFRYTNSATGRRKFIDGRHSRVSLACAVALRARKAGPVAVFTTSKGKTGVGGLAKKILQMTELGAGVVGQSPPASEGLSLLQDFSDISLGKEYQLSRLLRHGYAFHHGGLPQEIRRIIEEGIANLDIQILFCTSTLAEGVNLPIRTLVIHTLNRFNPDSGFSVPLRARTIKNILGRVGRAGKETRGRVVFTDIKDRSLVSAATEESELELASGRLLQLVQRIDAFFQSSSLEMTNELLDGQDPEFLDILDSIDRAVIELLPSDIEGTGVSGAIEELLDRTLAKYLAPTERIKTTLSELFILRAENFLQLVPSHSWSQLRSSGATLREWIALKGDAVLSSAYWETLDNALDDGWIEEVVHPFISQIALQESEFDPVVMQKVVRQWIGGATYVGIAEEIGIHVDQILSIISNEMGYLLHAKIVVVSQVAIAGNDELIISKYAQAWPAFLRFGVAHLQQLDLFYRGATDRLGVWGLQRWIHERGIQARKRELVSILRENRHEVSDYLESDALVPVLSVRRCIRELEL